MCVQERNWAVIFIFVMVLVRVMLASSQELGNASFHFFGEILCMIRIISYRFLRGVLNLPLGSWMSFLLGGPLPSLVYFEAV